MNLVRLKKPVKKNIRDVIKDERAINKAARQSIDDQKAVARKAATLRAELAR